MKAWRDPQRIADASRGSLFTVGFAIAGAGLIVSVLLASSDDSALGAGSEVLFWVLALNGVVIAALAVAAAFRALRHITGRRFREPAPRLHIRFIALFSFAAVVPAVLMAAFFAVVLSRGVEFWFGERVNTLVETVAEFARDQAPAELTLARAEMRSMASDLSQPEAVEGLTQNRILYVEYLRGQALAREFPSAYIIDRQSTVLARAEFAGAPAYEPPSERLFQLLDETEIASSNPAERAEEPDYVRLLTPLQGYENAYLYTVYYADLSLLLAAEAATVSFREARQSQRSAQVVFALVYGEATLLILIGAVWLALTAANRVVTPVGRLVSAAERVRRGDFEARVSVTREHDEIAALGRAFNRMTRQLGAQRQALVEASADAERRRAFIEAVLAGVEAGVIGVDGAGRITLVNRAAADLLGLDPEAVVGEPLTGAAPLFAAIYAETEGRSGDIAPRQMDAIAQDGSALHLNVRAARDEDGGFVITFDDITRLVAAQRSAAWRDVARRIAHEIKNPLTPIQLSAERLRRKYRKHVPEDDTRVFDQCVETIVRQVSDIGRMVDEFSAFARMPTPKMEAVDLAGIAESAVFAQRVASPAIKVTLARPDREVLAECDARLAGQAIANILKNAAESVSARMEADGGKAAGSIAVSVRADHGFAVVEAVDDGLGWPSADKSRLTEPYMTTREKGTGLGLAIVRRVMEDHGGRLELDDPPAKTGAVVRLAFPLLEPEETQAEAAADSPTEA